jgi:hypothetical protein
MHETDSCGEFIDDILNQGTVILYGYLSNAAAGAFKNSLMRMIQRGNHSSVAAKDVWETLRESIICHKCFEDYIQICEAHPPPDPDDAIAAFASSLPELPSTDGPATVQNDALNEEDNKEQRCQLQRNKKSRMMSCQLSSNLYLPGITLLPGNRCIGLSCMNWMPVFGLIQRIWAIMAVLILPSLLLHCKAIQTFHKEAVSFAILYSTI